VHVSSFGYLQAESYLPNGRFLDRVALPPFPTSPNPRPSIQNFQSESNVVLMLDSQTFGEPQTKEHRTKFRHETECPFHEVAERLLVASALTKDSQ